MRVALAASALIHVAVIGGAWLMLTWMPPPEETGVESISVDLISVEEFTSLTASTAQSSATETLVAAGAEMIADAEPVQEPPPEVVEPVKVAEVEPPPPEIVAAIEPIEEPEAAPEPLLQPVQEKQVEAQPAEQPQPEPVKEAEPKEKPKEKPKKKPKEQPKKATANAGNGGKANATVAASAASGSKGKGEASGNASVSKYPGLVQRALRRALRQPKGAGGARGEVQVTFVVSASGAASGIAVSKSSGHAVLDKEAVATVKRAKFPPIPADAGRNSWTFTMPLAFTR